MSKEIRKTIAEAIKKADSSYFFEDYTKQARAVVDVMVRLCVGFQAPHYSRPPWGSQVVFFEGLFRGDEE